MTPEDFKKALRDPDTKVLAIEMTPERKERLQKITDAIADHLIRITNGPLEAYMAVSFLMQSLEETLEARGFVHSSIEGGNQHEH